MSLDTKYRPRRFEDLLGQKATVRICRELVKQGKGFRQSYLFAGPYGSGKTTTARIFARALLCESPVEGDPCDECVSCRSILERESSLALTEVDAATNSGKDSIRKILEEIDFANFAGHRRIIIFDEAHQLSKDALDALLKPLEENAPGSEDKRLVVMLATTEPEKMKDTILSRCAPAFVIEPVSPEEIAKRAEFVCQQEGIPYDFEALKLIAEVKECHIRDVLKSIEGINMLGKIDAENVTTYLHLESSTGYLDVLENLGEDLTSALAMVDKLLVTNSPTTVYEKLAQMALLAFKAHLKVERVPLYLDTERVKGLYAKHGSALLTIASTLAERPGRPTAHMLACDLAKLHHGGLPQLVNFVQPDTRSADRKSDGSEPAAQISGGASKTTATGGKISRAPRQYDDYGVYVDERLVRKSGVKAQVSSPGESDQNRKPQEPQMDAGTFSDLLTKRLGG